MKFYFIYYFKKKKNDEEGLVLVDIFCLTLID